MFVRASFHDLDAMCQTLRAWDVEFCPLTGVPQDGTVGAFVQSFGSGIQYGYSEFTPGLSMFGTPPKGLITFNVMEPAHGRYWVRGHDLDDGMAWVFPVGGELRSVSAPGFQVHTLSVSEERIERIAVALEINLPRPSKRPGVFPIEANVLSNTRRHLRKLRDGATTFPLDPARDVLRLLVPRWVRPNSLESNKRISMRTRDIAVRKCLELIESQDLGEVPNDILLDRSSVSERTLQYAFRERFGVTPQAFIKIRRLANVKSALRRADPDKETVGNIAAYFGFWHLGRFASEYRKAFGELPSVTLGKKP